MFQFSAFASFRIIHLQCIGFPHSEMYGSSCICHSPYLIAAYHVLLRLSKPRHPPCALSNLSNSIVFLYLFTTSINSNMSMNFSFLDFKCLGLRYYPLDIYQTPHLKTLQDSWRITDSNRWPPACKAGALASWANPPINYPIAPLDNVVVPSRFELLTPTLSV